LFKVFCSTFLTNVNAQSDNYVAATENGAGNCHTFTAVPATTSWELLMLLLRLLA
jgi:hypothetical protein